MALEQNGFTADLIPETYTTKGLAKALVAVMQQKEKLLFPRAKQGSVEILKILEEHEIFCDAVPIYDVVGKHTRNMEHLQKLSCILFLSASGVESFMQYEAGDVSLLERIEKASVKIGCIGKVTEHALQNYGLKADILPEKNHVEGLVEAVLEQL